MPAPCSTSTLIVGAAVSRANYTTSYIKSAIPDKTSCLPNSGDGFPSSDLNTSGTIKTDPLKTHIDSLFTQVNGSTPPSHITTDASGVSNYQTKSAVLSNMIEDEYCYYYAIYNYILPVYLRSVAEALPSDNTAKAARETADSRMKDNVISINRKLNQLIQVYIGLINRKNTTLETYYTGATNINSVNGTITTTLNSLRTQADILQSATSDSEIKSAMIEYSIEKNQSSRNLLAIYGFMNIVAVGLIFYLYRSTKS